jgi:hypothetical protein
MCSLASPWSPCPRQAGMQCRASLSPPPSGRRTHVSDLRESRFRRGVLNHSVYHPKL